MNFILKNLRTGEQKSFPFAKILELLGDRVNDSITLDEEPYRISSCQSQEAPQATPLINRGKYTPNDDTIFYAPLSGETFVKSGNVDYVDTPFGKMINTHGELNSYVKLPIKYTAYDVRYLSFVFRYKKSNYNQGFFVDTPNDKSFLYYKGFYIGTDAIHNWFKFEQTGANTQCYIPLDTFQDGKIYLIQYTFNYPNGISQYSVYVNGVKTPHLTSYMLFDPRGTNQSINPKFGSSTNLSDFFAAPNQSDLCELLVESRAWTETEALQYANRLGFSEGNTHF